MTFGHDGWDPPPELRMLRREDRTYGGTCCVCKARMVLRTNSGTREQFWGCGAYPKCTYTEHYAAFDYIDMGLDNFWWG